MRIMAEVKQRTVLKTRLEVTNRGLIPRQVPKWDSECRTWSCVGTAGFRLQ
jgi:hypothetical protein